MPPPGFHPHAAEVSPRPALAMRSLLFVPADSAKKLDKAMTSGADALIVDLEDSIALDGKARARQSAAAFLKDAIASNAAAVSPGARQRTADRPHRRRSRRDRAGETGRHHAAEGRRRRLGHSRRRQARRARSTNGLPDGHIKILAIATETAAALFVAGTFAGASARLIGLTWGAEDLSAELGAQANRDAQGRFLDPYRLARVLCLAGAAAATCRRSTPSMSISATRTAFAANARKPAATVLSARWRSIRRRCRSSTRCSRRRAEAIAHAQAIVDAFAESPGAGVVGIGGVMYDRPHLARAEQVLARAATKN